MSNKIFTFGYGNRRDYSQLERFAQEHGIKYLVDVRQRSYCKWSPLWRGVELSRNLDSIGLNYHPESGLGNTSGTAEWIPRNSIEAEAALTRVATLLEAGSIVLMCAELDHRRCHRTAVAEKISKTTGAIVRHL